AALPSFRLGLVVPSCFQRLRPGTSNKQLRDDCLAAPPLAREFGTFPSAHRNAAQKRSPAKAPPSSAPLPQSPAKAFSSAGRLRRRKPVASISARPACKDAAARRAPPPLAQPPQPCRRTAPAHGQRSPRAASDCA